MFRSDDPATEIERQERCGLRVTEMVRDAKGDYGRVVEWCASNQERAQGEGRSDEAEEWRRCGDIALQRQEAAREAQESAQFELIARRVEL